MNDFERIPVRVKYIGGLVSRVIPTCLRRSFVTGTRGHCRSAEFVGLITIFGLEQANL